MTRTTWVAMVLVLAACKGEGPTVADTSTTSPPTPTAPPDSAALAADAPAPAPDAAPAPDGAATAPDAATPPDATAPTPDAAVTDKPEQARTRLVSPGAEPLRALRYTPQAGLTQTADLGMTTELELGATGQKMPTALPKTRMVIDAKVTAIDPNGGVGFQLTIAEADLADGATPGATRAGEKLAEVIRGMKGLAGDKATDARGLSRRFSLAFPEGREGPMTTAALRPVVQGFERAIDQMTVPFPEEAIGVGGKWEVTQKVVEAGMALDQTTTFEVTRIEGTRVSLAFTVTLAAPPGKLESHFANGLAAEVMRLAGSGEGTIEVDLGKVLPLGLSTRNRIAMGLVLDAPGDGGGNTEKRTLDVEMRVALEAKSR